MTELFLSIIIPAYNEERRLSTTLERIIDYLKGRDFKSEILVVDDGSRDRTVEIARACAPRAGKNCELCILNSTQNQGKGFTVQRGMLESRGAYALFTDADLSTPIEELTKLEREVIQGPYHVAIGSRALPDSRVEAHQSWLRETGGKVFNLFVRSLTGLPFLDTQCGFKLFNMDRCKEIFQRQNIRSFGFDVELLYMAKKWGLRTKEVPVIWRHSPDTKVRPVPDGFRMLSDLVRIRWNDWSGKYKADAGGIDDQARRKRRSHRHDS